jgi:alkanesulfonate monooxygenase SsuD/methylene tetrahydromethanopterin reductase-like flavin-dependent oxidoreductase (luciferase family)
MKPLHLGCTPWQFPLAGGAEPLARQALLAEELGYESFWLPEHHFGADAIPEPLMLLASVAAATRRIRLATTSYLLPLRHPLQAAAQVAVLDQLSGGRVILGVGRGFVPELFEAFQVKRSAKRELFAECLAGMRAAWEGAPVGSSGARLQPEPVQKPHPPVWVAALGPKALAQAGSLGLPYLASPLESLEALADNYAQHRAACTTAGHALPDAVPVMRTIFVSEDPELIGKVRELLGRRLTAMQQQSSALVRTLPRQLDDWAIVGTPRHVRETIARYREHLGITHLIATRLLLSDVGAAQYEASIRTLAEIAHPP